MSGLVVGLLRMILEFSYPVPACGEVDRRPAVLKDLHYLYFALLLCGLTAVVIVAVSLCTAPIPEEKAGGEPVLGPLPALPYLQGPGCYRPVSCHWVVSLVATHMSWGVGGSSLDY